MESNLIVGGLAISAIATLIAIPVGSIWKQRNPHKRPYTWGYFQGISAIIWGLGGGIAGLSYHARGTQDSYLAGAILALLLWAVPGFLVVRRFRWAWIPLTLLSLNPLWWVINTVYAKRRWAEMAKRGPLPAGAVRVTPRSVPYAAPPDRRRLTNITRISPAHFGLIATFASIGGVVLLWLIISVPDRNRADIERARFDLEQLDRRILDTRRSIDSVDNELRFWVPADPSVRPFGYVREMIDRTTQWRSTLETMLEIDRSHQQLVRESLARSIERRAQARVWYAIAAFVVAAAAFVFGWVWLTARHRSQSTRTGRNLAEGTDPAD